MSEANNKSRNAQGNRQPSGAVSSSGTQPFLGSPSSGAVKSREGLRNRSLREVEDELDRLQPSHGLGRKYAGPPRLYYTNGDTGRDGAVLRPGTFYIKVEELGVIEGFNPGAWQDFVRSPWGLDTRHQTKGQGEVGISAEVIEVALFPRYRTQPYMIQRHPQTGHEIGKEWLDTWTKGSGAQFYTEIPCYVRGIVNSEGLPALLVWTMHGMGGKAFTARGDGIFHIFQNGMLAGFNQLRRQRERPDLLSFAIWLPVGNGVDSRGRLRAVKAGFNHFVTTPGIRAPKVIGREYLLKQYVGNTIYKQAESDYERLLREGWFDYKRPSASSQKSAEDDDGYQAEADSPGLVAGAPLPAGRHSGTGQPPKEGTHGTRSIGSIQGNSTRSHINIVSDPWEPPSDTDLTIDDGDLF